jgi:hypothetical protein
VSNTTKKIDAHTESEFRAEMARLRDAIGHDAFRKLSHAFALANEAALRESAPPDHSVLAFLDEYYASQSVISDEEPRRTSSHSKVRD